MIFLLFSLVAIGLVPFTTQVHAENIVKVEMNGELMTFPDQQPMINQDGRTIVPVRFVATGLGAYVSWDSKTQTVTIQKDRDIIKLTIGQKQAIKNGQVLSFDTSASIVNSRTMVPLRFVSEGLGAYVAWDGATKTVIVKTKVQDTTGDQTGSTGQLDPVFSQTDIWKLTNITTEDKLNGGRYFIKNNQVVMIDNSNNEYKAHPIIDTLNPYINQQVYNVTKSLITKDGYVYNGLYLPGVMVYFANSYISAVNNADYFDYTFYETKRDNPKHMYNEDSFSDHPAFSLRLISLYDDAEKGLVNPTYSQKLEDSLVALFGKDTGTKISDYILNSYDTYYHTPGTAQVRETTTIDNIKIDYFAYGTNNIEYFYFAYLN